MATFADPTSTPVPHSAAPDLFDYPQFSSCAIPDECEAIEAYRGFIRPFCDDENARGVLRALDADLDLAVSGGRLHSSVNYLKTHPLEHLLVSMATPCTVLALDFAGRQHPRAYLLKPRMLDRFSQSPHLRADKSLMIDGIWTPALCVYSGNLMKYEASTSRLQQFLDQVATYLAKYLIWLRTRVLLRRTVRGIEIVHRPNLSENIHNLDVLLSKNVFWDGHWPGASAPTGPIQHLATIKPSDECWCWSGEKYRDCCRLNDLNWRNANI